MMELRPDENKGRSCRARLVAVYSHLNFQRGWRFAAGAVDDAAVQPSEDKVTVAGRTVDDKVSEDACGTGPVRVLIQTELGTEEYTATEAASNARRNAFDGTKMPQQRAKRIQPRAWLALLGLSVSCLHICQSVDGVRVVLRNVNLL